jgi:hypothetical protein
MGSWPELPSRFAASRRGQPTSGITGGSFVVPTTGETSANVFFRIHLTVSSDPEDGNLSAVAFTWRVDFHHDDHIHPFLQCRRS